MTTGGFSAQVPLFDAETLELVGVHSYNDVPFGACVESEYIYGLGLLAPTSAVAQPREVCAEITSCTVCGEATASSPPCSD